MPAFAIMRCTKIKTLAQAAGSFRHTFREQNTPNADADLTPKNEHFAAHSTDEAMGRLRTNLPTKRRKDAVLAVEYMMTASPEWFANADEAARTAFFDASRAWLADKYGEGNIIACTVHNDETTPHMAAYVTPITPDGRLAAKNFIGGHQKLSADQTSYAATVEHLGLRRGLKGSKAQHRTIKRYYELINRTEKLADKYEITPDDVTAKVLKKGIFSTTTERPEDVAARLNEKIEPLAAAIGYARAAMDKANGWEKTAKTIANQRDRMQKETAAKAKTLDVIFDGLSNEQKRKIIALAKEAREMNKRQRGRGYSR